ncbi:MAG: response regulator [Alphaproteobacteria bacterium]|nr:response regulator [Alphaproteobacteria bacterium]
MPQIGSLLIIFGTFVWCGSFSYLSTHATSVLEWLCLVSLGLVTVATLAYWIYANKHQSIHKHKLKLIHAGISTLTPAIEEAIFDESGKTIWTTHPNTYPNQEEFLRKILQRLSATSEIAQLKAMIEERRRGEILVTGGSGSDQKWWLIATAPLDLGGYFGRKGLMVALRDITSHFSNHTQLKNTCSLLESFIDKAPIALVYTNTSGIITGANTTFCRWLGLPREQLLGTTLDGFLGDEWKQGKAIIPVRSPNAIPFKVLALTSPKSQPLLFCRADGLFSMGASGGVFKQAFSDATIPAVMISEEGQIIDYNPAFSMMVGDVKPRQDFFEMIDPAIRSETTTKFRRAFERALPPSPFEIRFNEDKIHTTTYVSHLMQEDDLPALMLQFLDISEKKRLERQFIQSQKMQAVGQLAGGIAHDFNNLLTAMIGYCDLLLQRYLPNDPAYTDIMQIKQNANRAANLVRQLLAFSRQQTLQPKVVHITDNLADLSTLLRRLIGAGIDLKMIHGRDLWPVKVDVSQLEQVIINLVVNARDAITNGGTLTIRTSNFQCLKQQRMGHDLVAKGDYVMIEVIDTGHGIDPEHLEHIFEPFFSTKEVGEGTGLGLSTVYGIVKQTGGFVLVESTINEGTNFKILLPRYAGEEETHIPHIETPSGDLTGGGTILLVEDEDAVRMFSARALREKGYRVIEADSGESALNILTDGERFDLLVTDVVMPKMDGPTLSKKIRDLYPETKTIFISGYTEDTFRKNLDHNTKIHFLPKPFTLKDLASKVKEVLTLN